jgi:cGMP-dependent 3',5'-cyclic phosphodiesterase
MHALVHKQVQKAEARYKLSQELLVHHMKVQEWDVQHMIDNIKSKASEELTEEISRFDFCPRDVSDALQTVQMAVKMFYDLNFVTTFKVQDEKLVRFMLLVHRGYRDTPYHNWWHAFSAGHFAYTLMKNLNLIENGIIT